MTTQEGLPLIRRESISSLNRKHVIQSGKVGNSPAEITGILAMKYTL
jgi:hypothetical protein